MGRAFKRCLLSRNFPFRKGQQPKPADCLRFIDSFVFSRTAAITPDTPAGNKANCQRWPGLVMGEDLPRPWRKVTVDKNREKRHFMGKIEQYIFSCMPANLKNSISIRVALFPEAAGNFEGWIAQCLDFDLIAQGKTVEQAQQSFQRTLAGHVGLCLRKGENPFPANLAKPPKETGKMIALCGLRGLQTCNIAYSRLEKPHNVLAW